MPQQDEQEYLEQRRQKCERMSRNALDPGIALIHRQFAAEYSRRLELMQTRRPYSDSG